jgi:EpsI family protein
VLVRRRFEVGRAISNGPSVVKVYFKAVIAVIVILAAAVLAEVMTPRESMARGKESFDIEQILPKDFGEWKSVPGVRLVIPPEQQAMVDQTYSQQVARGYVDRDGHAVMLLVAYGPSQSTYLELHNPELCYISQGFQLSPTIRTDVSYRDGAPPMTIKRLVAQRAGRVEPISYWMIVGKDLATGVLGRQYLKLKYGLRGLVPDGILVRVSTVGIPGDAAFPIQNRFIRDFIAAIGPDHRKDFIGDQPGALSSAVESRL